MSRKITELLQIPSDQHDLGWLKQGLQAAIELELATLPPYLCGLWSIKSQDGPAFDLIESVALDEMLHMGLCCNMLAAIGGTPTIVSGYKNIEYPGPLPGGVRPNLTVYLGGLTPDYIKSVYMEIEYPQGGPIAPAVEETYPTIGAFYDALTAAFQSLSPTITTKSQLTSPGVGLVQLKTLGDVFKAIQKIKEQGEGTSQSPEAQDFGGELAHYYRFGEILHGQKFIQVSGKWDYKGDPIPFPVVYHFTPIPAGGYPNPPNAASQALQDFDQAFAGLLTSLDRGWATGTQADLGKAVGAMLKLQSLANKLMQITRADQPGVYGPDFRLP
jgi:hypothetical protein